ncbi:DUF3169 family protein [Streptococcus cuniculi]|uniref:DUF3169 family protein n=1 Tax=Streptococcus cuniculi TaxID=1432788 RepID=A0A4Y9JDE4_9STRE|nr:DUF3169 family protein [Streptococcus cuniculi]MBF0778061.1 DUF3169 family protein [Streptococcus cuniculi]TFU98066.1 DUF3169 family protein [Streptococcus cuniculi]
MKKRRGLKGFLFLFMCGFVGYFVGSATAAGTMPKDLIQQLLTLDLYVYLAQGASLLLAGMAFYFLHYSRKDTLAYQKAEDSDDEEGIEKFYKNAHRNLEYGTIAYNICSVSILFSLLGAFYMVAVNAAQIKFLLLASMFYIPVFFLTGYYRKTLKMVRHYDFPKFAMPEDALAFVRSYDEGEREANYENSFMTLFHLNQIILPALYIILDVISFALQEFQLTAFLIVVFIHVYINIRSISMVKKYFK